MPDTNIRFRQILGTVGAASGLALWALWKMFDAGMLTDRTALTLASFVAATLGAHLALSGPLNQKQAIARSLLLGAASGLLITLAALRYDEVGRTQPFAIAFVVLIWHVALPFLIAQGLGRGLRHYPTLFAQAWNLFERLIAAWIFVGLTWAVIFLSDLVLGLVGINLMTLISEIEVLGPMITGAAFGLGLAVMLEIGGAIVAALLQRLLRLLLPFLLAVVVIFLAILPFRGFEAVFGVLSAGAIFVALVALMATMVTAAAGPDRGQEVQSRPMQLATRAMAVLMPLPALGALWALGLRVGQYGWTPERMAAGLLMATALLSAVLYLVAALRRPWHDGVRRGNVVVALAAMAAAVFWVGVLPTERIAASGVVARFEAGTTAVDQLDIYSLGNWGRPGAAALEALRAKADAGDTKLAALLDGETVLPDPDELDRLRADLKARMPVQPATATATRDALFDLAGADDLRNWTSFCQEKGSPAAYSCGIIVADFLTDQTGEEVMLLENMDWGLQMTGFSFGPDGLNRHQVADGSQIGYGNQETSAALFTQLMAAPPSLMPAPMNIIPQSGGIMFLFNP